jgi:hypothetical protein
MPLQNVSHKKFTLSDNQTNKTPLEMLAKTSDANSTLESIWK